MTASVGTAPADKFAQVSGLKLHYLDWGGKGRTHVLLHGITGNAHNWDSFAPKWAQHSHVLALDQRGHGDSDWTKEGYPVQAFGSDLYEFARQLNLAPFDATGHSLGARNLIDFAGDHSDMLAHLVLSECGPELPREGARNINRRVGGRPTSFRSWEEAETYYKEAFPDWSPDRQQQTMKHALRSNYSGKLVWKADPELFWITGSFGLKEVPYLWAQCAKITCKTIILHGEKSEILAAETVDRMLALMPNATVHHFKGATHNILADAPGEYEAVIRDFLKT
ncbi:MAG: alpha/beta hydrolase [Chloroflexi bacterium]|nr:alpha/beta hydrolase [Chloroflexota bacterium]